MKIISTLVVVISGLMTASAFAGDIIIREASTHKQLQDYCSLLHVGACAPNVFFAVAEKCPSGYSPISVSCSIDNFGWGPRLMTNKIAGSGGYCVWGFDMTPPTLPTALAQITCRK